jgi:hypothetical protein
MILGGSRTVAGNLEMSWQAWLRHAYDVARRTAASNTLSLGWQELGPSSQT